MFSAGGTQKMESIRRKHMKYLEVTCVISSVQQLKLHVCDAQLTAKNIT